MPARANFLRTSTHAQPTPAPLLFTSRATLPSLPPPLHSRSIPPGTTPLFSHTLSDWIIFNQKAKSKTSAIFPTLSPSISHFSNTPGIHILSPRSANSTQTITETPGKALHVSLHTRSQTVKACPEDLVTLHKALSTDFVVSLSDHPPLHVSPSDANATKRAKRQAHLLDLFKHAAETHHLHPTQQIISIAGSHDPHMRTQATREATLYAQRVGDVAGYAIDGLFSGESLDARAKCIEAVTRNLPSDGIRFLTGCAGAPWDVIDAVSNGVDVIHASYPFELAAHGFASHLSSADTVNLRDRVHVTDRTGLVKGCECWVCQGFTKGYVRHLLEVREMMGTSLLVAHNVWDYYVWFDRIRAAVDEGRWDSFRDDWQRAVERVRVGDVA